MIDPLDGLLRDLIQSRVPGFAGQTQVAFVAPNADWKADLVAAVEERFNFYLYDVRENVRLRSNEWRQETVGTKLGINRPSPRLDCSYLVTAWSPVAFSALLDPAREEHERLYQALEVLLRFNPLVAAEVYSVPVPSGMNFPTFQGIAGALTEQPLPVSVSLPDAVREPAEFWTTMKVDSRPAIHLTVTIPVVLSVPDAEYSAVTTLTGVYAHGLSTDVLTTIGGRVVKGAGATPLGRAFVRLRHVGPAPARGPIRRTSTDASGRFTFSGLIAGRYDLEAIAGSQSKTETIEVPSQSGEYEVRLP